MFAITVTYSVLISKVLSVAETDEFTIATKGCTIRSFPLVSENIETIVRPPPTTHTCAANNRLVDSNSTHFWLTDDALDMLNFNARVKEESYCCYRNFSCTNNIENIRYGECIQFSTVIQSMHEFVRVECYAQDEKIYDDFFVFTSIQKYPVDNDDRYNVLILGIESMSRMNFHRTMINTAEYLHLKGAIGLLGYNKVGDNSFPNLFPLLFGKSFDYIKDKCFKHNYYNSNCSFIWDKFKSAGYLTALGSDSIAGFLGEYEYNLTRAPTDFYLQPFMFEARHLFKNEHYNYHQCLGSSDHGMRWGPIVQTEQGRLEERLPLLKVLFPDSFKQRYKQAYRNFQKNSHRLTTPYDIYETLNDLVNPVLLEDAQIKFRSLSHNSKTTSLFLPISDRRTCESVGIKEHWCTCSKGKKLKIKNRNRGVVGEKLIFHINKLLKPYPKCHKLRISKTLQVTMMRSGEGRIYNAVLETTPGGAILEGTLYRQRDHWTVSGSNVARNYSIRVLSSGTCYKSTHLKGPFDEVKQIDFISVRQCVTKPVSDGEGQDKPPPEKKGLKGLILKFKQMYKDYWYVLLPVHFATSAVWFGGFYYAVRSGVDVIGILESYGISETLLEPLKKSGAGYFAVAFALYKLATPLRYAVTVGGATYAIRKLTSLGLIKPVPSRERIKEMLQDKKEMLQEKKYNLQDRFNESKRNYQTNMKDRRARVMEEMRRYKTEMKNVKNKVKRM